MLAARSDAGNRENQVANDEISIVAGQTALCLALRVVWGTLFVLPAPQRQGHGPSA